MAKVRELKSHLMFGFLVVILLGQALPVMGQSSNTVDHVVINEVDINPSGDDSKIVSEWIELYNPTDQIFDLGGWSIGATTGLKTTYKIAEGTKLKSGGFVTFSYGPLWFPDTSSVIQLKNKNATVVDVTPTLRDVENGLKSWQRITDGLDTDSASDWAFRTANAGSSNGKITSSTTSESLSVKVSTDKRLYIFGDAVKISGEVSKRITVPHQGYTEQRIHVTITGPENFEKTFSLFPDRMNAYKTEMKTDKAFKIPEGDYKAVVEYGGEIAETTFTIFEKTFTPLEKEASAMISISTDKSSYIPGETAIISANTSKIVPFAGMKFKVFDPNKIQVYDGTLYPDTKGKFSTKIFINSVKPVFGKYNVVATYDEETTTSSYELVPEIKEDILISLTTDKKVYGLGDTVKITGRSNKVWIPSLDIEIVQTYASQNVQNTFRIKDITRLAGDSTFLYEIKIPNDNTRIGDYKVTVSKEIGSAEVQFKVVENPSQFVETDTGPFSISTDKSTYNFGDKLIISGKVRDSKNLPIPVKVSIIKQGKDIKKNSPDAIYSFTGVPDTAGNFKIETNVYVKTFEKGEYLIKAVYGVHRASTSFTVNDSIDQSMGMKITANTDKEVYGAGEEVKLTGKVSTFATQSSYAVKMIDPNGKITSYGITIDNGQFSWSWTVPTRATVYGTYKIIVSSDSDKTDVSFKVSKDPESETKSQSIMIETDKDVYNSGETVVISGTVIKKVSGAEGLVVNVKPEIIVKTEANKEIYKAFPDLSAAGNFKTSLKLITKAFKAGQYKISAKYYDAKAQAVFKVDDRFSVGTDTPLVLLMATDKEKYLPGGTVNISGKTSKIISVLDVDVKITKEDQLISDVTVRFDQAGFFNYDYTIPQNANLGTYTVKADTDFDTTTALFEVVNELPPEPVTTPVEEPTTGNVTKTEPTTVTSEPTKVPKKIIDTVNRITDSSIPITMETKNVGDKIYVPTLFEGSLRVNVGDESKVNIKVISGDGTCIIGQDDDCKITKSTREGSSLYKTVNVDGTDLKIRYSGNGAKLEKFTISPKDSDRRILEGDWSVEITKDNQVSRFYYKISYTAIK